MSGIAEKYTGRIGERARNAAVKETDFAEEFHLLFVERMVRLLGADEMAHQQGDAVIFRANARRQGRRFIGGNTEPVHAGVDVQRRSATPLVGGAEGIPFRELHKAANHRTSVDSRQRLARFRARDR